MDSGFPADMNPDGPAMVPPPGEVSNFDSPDGNHTLGFAIIITGSVIATLSVVVRLISRALTKRWFGLADAFLVCALGLYGGFQYVIWHASAYPGIGYHQWNFPLHDMNYVLYNVHLGALLYGPAMMCLKLSILIDWLHIFASPSRNFMFWSIHALIWSNVIFYTVGEFAEIFQCIPSQKIWDIFYEGGYCKVDIAAHNASAAIVNLISDLAILALPNWAIWRMNVSFHRKLGVSLLFTVGLLCCIMGALRLISLVPLIDSPDLTYWMPILGLYSSAEIGIGFMIMGLPAMPKVVKSLPFSESVVSLIRSFGESGARWSKKANDAIRAPTLPRPLTRKRRGMWTITELQETELGKTQGVTSTTMLSSIRGDYDVLDAGSDRASQAPLPSIAEHGRGKDADNMV